MYFSLSILYLTGSILVEFDIQGDTEVTQEAMYNDLYDEVISLTFNGYTLYADTYMLVNGKEYDPRVRLWFVFKV